MIKNMTLGRYYPVKSLVHEIDPRIKIVVAVSLMITILLTNSYAIFVTLACLILISIKFARIPMAYVLKGLRPILFIIISTASINIFLTSGIVLFEYGFIQITYEGVDRAAKLVFRIILLMTGTSLLTLTTTPITLTDGLEKLFSPLKVLGVPVHDFAMMISISLRFVPVLLDEANRIMKAQASRGVDFQKGSIVKRVKNIVSIMIPLFVSVFKRGDELAVAMEARCYRGGEGRTKIRQLKIKTRDIAILFCIIAIQFILLYVQYLYILV
ncbi:UNVERIFIED_CONTAM: energy-coupling factor transport system permease protein [Acetivibrio alkalicellulosi]